jgi:hypothetical protein
MGGLSFSTCTRVSTNTNFNKSEQRIKLVAFCQDSMVLLVLLLRVVHPLSLQLHDTISPWITLRISSALMVPDIFPRASING